MRVQLRSDVKVVQFTKPDSSAVSLLVDPALRRNFVVDANTAKLVCHLRDSGSVETAVARLSGADSLSVMLLDVLSAEVEIPVCVAYEIEGRRTDRFPSHVDDLRKARPIYETLPGWQTEISSIRTPAGLPAAALAYLKRLGELVGHPVEIASVGPDREQTILM